MDVLPKMHFVLHPVLHRFLHGETIVFSTPGDFRAKFLKYAQSVVESRAALAPAKLVRILARIDPLANLAAMG